MKTKLGLRPKKATCKEQVIAPIVPVQLETTDFMPSDPSLRQHKIKAEVRKGNVEHIMPMIALKARATLEKIPPHLRNHLGLDDLIAEGVGAASTTVLKAHSPKREAGYVTYLWTSLDNLYTDVLKAIFAEKRFVKGMYSLEDVYGQKVASREDITFKEMLNRKADKFSQTEERLICRIDAERAFLRLYKYSTPDLRRYLIMWLLQPGNTKLKKYGKKFDKAIAELGESGPSAFLEMEHCNCIWKDAECRRSICRVLVRKYRTAKSDTDTRVPRLKNSIESLVLKIAYAKVVT